MGNYQSIFEETPDQQKATITADQKTWITEHVELTGLSIIEVQRAWFRFQQLGGTKLGYLEKSALEREELNKDILIKNIISNLPKDKKGRLSFHVWLNFLRWLEEGKIAEKLKVLHSFLNNGHELNERTFQRILTKMYPDFSEEEINVTVQLLMKQLDPDATGNIQEHQFVTNVLKNYDEFELNEILTVDMIPKEVLENSEVPMNDPREEHRGATDNKRRAAVSFKESYNGPSRTGHNSRFESSEEYLDNRTLESVAKKAVNKDWEKLAIKLGFLEYDIQAFKLKNKGYNLETMSDILFTWRDQDPFMATKSRLRRYLEDSQMMDAAALVRS